MIRVKLVVTSNKDGSTVNSVINTSAPPLPTPFRCFEFGKSVAQAIAAYDKHLRVGIIGSGGISHAPPSGSVESEAPADAPMVQRLIHGRAQVEANEEARQQGLISGVLAGKFRGERATVDLYSGDRLAGCWPAAGRR